MSSPAYNSTAIIVLPAGARGKLRDTALTRWLSRGLVEYLDPCEEVFYRVLKRIGVPAPGGGLAELRLSGQTGERTTGWIAAADPLHLETRLHSLRMRRLGAHEVAEAELRSLFRHLQQSLGKDSSYSFTSVGRYGYLRGAAPIETAPMSAAVLHGLPPDEYVPAGDSAAIYHKLLGEIQMALHEHPVNLRRAESGQAVINSLWIWGGGMAPDITQHELPKLVADDALFRGYWQRCGAEVADWHVDLPAVIRDPGKGLVVVMPDMGTDALDRVLHHLRAAQQRGALKTMTLFFGDGLTVSLAPADRLRFWRGISPLLTTDAASD